jgi:hypothetical protein
VEEEAVVEVELEQAEAQAEQAEQADLEEALVLQIVSLTEEAQVPLTLPLHTVIQISEQPIQTILQPIQADTHQSPDTVIMASTIQDYFILL